jgi:hypothetical protein
LTSSPARAICSSDDHWKPPIKGLTLSGFSRTTGKRIDPTDTEPKERHGHA